MFWNKDKIPDYSKENDKDFFTMDADIEESDVEEVKEKNSNNNDENNYNGISQKITNSFNNLFTDRVKLNKFVNIILIVVSIIAICILTDVIMVTRGNNGPIFAIKVKTYNDGGTKEYLGLGYKVIKYNEKNGRKDIILGKWSIKYDTNYLDVDVVDLSIMFNDNFKKFTDTYMNKYLKVTGNVKSISKETIVLEYVDKDGKYTMSINGSLLNYKKLKVGNKVSIVGTLYDYANSEELNLYMKNCYIK